MTKHKKLIGRNHPDSWFDFVDFDKHNSNYFINYLPFFTSMDFIKRTLYLSLVCTLPSPVSCLAWNGSGSKFAVGDFSGNISVWKILDFCISEWEEVYSSKLPHERIVNAAFLSSSRVVRLNQYNKDSILYNEKFEFGPQVTCSGDKRKKTPFTQKLI